jgi:acetaldehyde dehydrogenase/alcohol dehydrogenase
LITHVIRFNATDRPRKQAILSQYKYPQVRERYGRLADVLCLGGRTLDDKINLLCTAIEDLRSRLDLPGTIKEAGVSDASFQPQVRRMAEQAFDDQCTGANPVYPSIDELEALLQLAFHQERAIAPHERAHRENAPAMH